MKAFEFTKQIIQKDDVNFYDNLSDSDKKTFSSYMIQRFLSMNENWIDLINFVNKYTFTLKDSQYFKLITLLIPPQKNTFYKYIKKKSSTKYNKEVMKCIVEYYQCSLKEARDYYILLSKEEKINLIKKYGYSEKEIKKITKGL